MTTIREIMTRQLFSCVPEDSANDALEYLMMLNIHAAPVLDPATHEPKGMISLSDLTGRLDGETVEQRMSYPAAFVLQTATAGEAARVIAHTGFHHLVVVDGKHRAVGFISAIDVIRAQQGWTRPGAPSSEPPPGSPELEWSGDEALTETGVLAAPEGPGVFVLLRVPLDQPSTVVWAQSATDLRGRLTDLFEDPPPRLARHLERGQLHFRAAAVPDEGQRRRALLSVLEGSFGLEPPDVP
ncbi:MAG: CBS domain-containing protein [Myxococcales bacterium]|nr:CBS domain-containing protein [Myxococcales bacterium]MCB9716029.1 CBS domain-containing protein [Myxococcales bacterium]